MNVDRPALGQAAAQRLRRRRRLPDPGRGGQHGHHRLQRRAQPRGRGRRHARLVPQAAPALRHHLPHPLPDPRACSWSRSSSAGATCILLGEAYAFGVVWSFVFKALAMVVLRFKDRTAARVQGAAQRPRRQRRDPDRPDADLPDPAASRRSSTSSPRRWPPIGGLMLHGRLPRRSSWSRSAIHEKRRRGEQHEHLEQFNQQTTPRSTPEPAWA